MDEIIIVSNEEELILVFTLIFLRLDPDIIYGYLPDKESWFFLFYRGWRLGLDLSKLMSRTGIQYDLLFNDYNEFIDNIFIN